MAEGTGLEYRAEIVEERSVETLLATLSLTKDVPNSVPEEVEDGGETHVLVMGKLSEEESDKAVTIVLGAGVGAWPVKEVLLLLMGMAVTGTRGEVFKTEEVFMMLMVEGG